MKYTIKVLISIVLLFFSSLSFAAQLEKGNNEIDSTQLQQKKEIESLQETLWDYTLAYKKNIYIENPFQIDLSSIDELLQENYWEIELVYTWNLQNETISQNKKLSYIFQESWIHNIKLTISWKVWSIQEVVYSSDISVFVYKASLAFIISELEKNNFYTLEQKAQEKWILLTALYMGKENELQNINLKDIYRDYNVSSPRNTDYLIIWWEKEFLFTALSLLSQTSENVENILLVSSYNTVFLKNYIHNSVWWLSHIPYTLLLQDIHIEQILKATENFQELATFLYDNAYNPLEISQKQTPSIFLFISGSLQKLWNTQISQSELYLILFIPIFLTLISISKHLIGFNTLGIIIPLFFILLSIILGIWISIWAFIGFVIFNLVISRFISKYVLLYTPKIIFVMILNIFLILVMIHIWNYTEIISLPVESILPFILFIIVNERLLNIIFSKEFWEYKESIYWTLILVWICYGIFSIDPLKILLFSYPELLIFLLPINFYIAKFTGLRVTEYFRFKELLGDPEEE